jgi:hypothetical protein
VGPEEGRSERWKVDCVSWGVMPGGRGDSSALRTRSTSLLTSSSPPPSSPPPSLASRCADVGAPIWRRGWRRPCGPRGRPRWSWPRETGRSERRDEPGGVGGGEAAGALARAREGEAELRVRARAAGSDCSARDGAAEAGVLVAAGAALARSGVGVGVRKGCFAPAKGDCTGHCAVCSVWSAEMRRSRASSGEGFSQGTQCGSALLKGSDLGWCGGGDGERACGERTRAAPASPCAWLRQNTTSATVPRVRMSNCGGGGSVQAAAALRIGVDASPAPPLWEGVGRPQASTTDADGVLADIEESGPSVFGENVPTRR